MISNEYKRLTNHEVRQTVHRGAVQGDASALPVRRSIEEIDRANLRPKCNRAGEWLHGHGSSGHMKS